MKIWQIKKGQGPTFSNKENLSCFMISLSMIPQIRDCFVDFSRIRDCTCLKLRRLLFNEGRKKHENSSASTVRK